MPRTHTTEFPDCAVPQWVRDMVAAGILTDESWHDDVSPRFHTAGVALWVDYQDGADRELGGARFRFDRLVWRPEATGGGVATG